MQENDNDEFKKIDMHIIFFSISANLKNDSYKAYLQAFMSWECTLARISQISLSGLVKMKKLIYTVLDLVLMHCTYKQIENNK